jgi:pimeloyl-ACP methyl ester carboxylesterase
MRYWAGLSSSFAKEYALIWCELPLFRPGFGGSTPVPLSQRIAVWIEAVPLVLAKLGVKHVAVLSHSAGTIYSLNTLGQLREILDPGRPYVAFIGKLYTKHCLENVLHESRLGERRRLNNLVTDHHILQHLIFIMTIPPRS